MASATEPGIVDWSEALIILAAVLVAAGCTWGLSRRLAEYR
ncbi:MAG: hypothetical protein ACLP01_30665 [Solirubrobacteraceae bacterium]